MQGYLSLVLHAHLPFVRHPEHDRFLEENWLFEAITECYLPLLEVLEGWHKDGLPGRITLSLSPTLCAMLQDPLLQHRYLRHLERLLELAEKEIVRTYWIRPCHELAWMYRNRFAALRDKYLDLGADVVGAFRKLQEAGRIEIITCAATHALLPLLADHRPSLRAQVRVAVDHYRDCFGRDPVGIWLPECGYAPGIDAVLQELNLRWFIVETHGLLQARPRPRYGVFAPVFTPGGVAAFGRDPASARQVWSRRDGYPGDPRYRDFYRDVGFDLDLDYVRPYLPTDQARTFTGVKYHAIGGSGGDKPYYVRAQALAAAREHAAHFLTQRREQIREAAALLDRPPLLVAPYDAELFGHWWYEGPEFLDFVVRETVRSQDEISLLTPTDYLRRHPTQQVATPAASTWGDGGHLQVWLNEKNAWIQPHVRVAQTRMTELARRHPDAQGLLERGLNQAARELLLAQASDWPFILTTGTSPDYARRRVTTHLSRFLLLYEQLLRGSVDEPKLREMEWQDNLFPKVDYRLWA